MTRRRAFRGACLWGLALAGCAAPARWSTFRDGADQLEFPGDVEVRQVAEGPWARATVAHVVHDGRRFELARFVLTERVSPERRAALVEEVLRGLGARPGVAEVTRRQTTVAGRPATALTLRMDSGEVAVYRIFRRDRDTLLELSVAGPASGMEAVADRFFGSYDASTLEAAPRSP